MHATQVPPDPAHAVDNVELEAYPAEHVHAPEHVTVVSPIAEPYVLRTSSMHRRDLMHMKKNRREQIKGIIRGHRASHPAGHGTAHTVLPGKPVGVYAQ